MVSPYFLDHTPCRQLCMADVILRLPLFDLFDYAFNSLLLSVPVHGGPFCNPPLLLFGIPPPPRSVFALQTPSAVDLASHAEEASRHQTHTANCNASRVTPASTSTARLCPCPYSIESLFLRLLTCSPHLLNIHRESTPCARRRVGQTYGMKERLTLCYTM